MKVIFICGPHAVGKMTIGEILAEKLKLPLLHNHMTLELIQPFLGWTDKTFELSRQFRLAIFENVALNEKHSGLIFTFVESFDSPVEVAEIEAYKEAFTSKGHEIYFVELEADLAERLRRNKTENRLLKKPSKRDLVHSEENLLITHESHRLNSLPGEIQEKHYLRLDVTNLTAEAAANRIMTHFN